MSGTPAITVEGPIVYARPSGKALRLNLYRPAEKAKSPRPGVVLIHGGGWFGGMRQQLRWYGRAFAEQGYVAIAVDYRRMFRWAFPHCLHDVKAAVRWLRRNAETYGVDKARIAALGNSAGGHLACMLAATRPEHGFEGEGDIDCESSVAASICLYGPQDLTYYLQPKGPLKVVAPVSAWYINHFAERDRPGVTDALAGASPLTYLDERTAPIMFVHGTRDWVAPYEHSELVHARLRELGVPTDFLRMEGRNHAFDFIFWEERRQCFDRMLSFLSDAFEREPRNPACAVGNDG